MALRFLTICFLPRFKKYAKVLQESLQGEFDSSALEVELVNDGSLEGRFAVVLEDTGEVLYEHPESVVVVDPQLTEMEQLVIAFVAARFFTMTARPPLLDGNQQDRDVDGRPGVEPSTICRSDRAPLQQLLALPCAV